MKRSTKIGLGFVATGVLTGFCIGLFDLQHLRTPIWIGLGSACAVVVFVVKYREARTEANSKR
jgi:hypothetical protein